MKSPHSLRYSPLTSPGARRGPLGPAPRAAAGLSGGLCSSGCGRGSHEAIGGHDSKFSGLNSPRTRSGQKGPTLFALLRGQRIAFDKRHSHVKRRVGDRATRSAQQQQRDAMSPRILDAVFSVDGRGESALLIDVAQAQEVRLLRTFSRAGRAGKQGARAGCRVRRMAAGQMRTTTGVVFPPLRTLPYGATESGCIRISLYKSVVPDFGTPRR